MIRRRVRNSCLIAVAVALALAVSASAARTSDNKSLAKRSGEKIGASYPFIGISPFFGVESALTEAAGKAAGFSVIPSTDAKSDTGKQISDVKSLIAEGTKGIILVPLDSNAVGPAVDYAVSKGIPVVGQDVAVNSPKVAVNVRTDNVAMGAQGCTYIGNALKGSGVVLDITGTLTNQNGLDRKNGFDNCMKKKFPKITLVSRPTDWSGAKAADVLQTVLVQYPNLNAIFMASDTNMEPAVVQVLKNKNKLVPVGTKGHVIVGGIDGGGPYGLGQIRAKNVDFTVEQPMLVYTAQAIHYLKLAMAGQKFHPGPDGHGGHIVNQDGVLMDYLPSPIISLNNVNSSKWWGNQAVAKKLFHS